LRLQNAASERKLLLKTPLGKKKRKQSGHRGGKPLTPAVHIDSVIRTIRGEKVILDGDLAAVYGVPTKRLNSPGKRTTT
jgi:hypothetical protein